MPVAYYKLTARDEAHLRAVDAFLTASKAIVRLPEWRIRSARPNPESHPPRPIIAGPRRSQVEQSSRRSQKHPIGLFVWRPHRRK